MHGFLTLEHAIDLFLFPSFINPRSCENKDISGFRKSISGAHDLEKYRVFRQERQHVSKVGSFYLWSGTSIMGNFVSNFLNLISGIVGSFIFDFLNLISGRGAEHVLQEV